MTTELALIEDDAGVIQLLLDLEAAGACDEVSLTLTDPEMEYETWEALGRFLGSLDRRSRWYLGDWLNFGESLFGHRAAQGVESTLAERYSEAERVTGLDHQTLINIASVCGRVNRTERRRELGFWIHGEVAKLPQDEQKAWLDHAITEGLSKSKLRSAIAEAKNPSAAAGDGDGEGGESGPLSKGERLEHAARLVYTRGQPTAEGYLVPSEVWSQLVEALGEER